MVHKSTPEIPQANSMSSFASHPSKLTPKQLKVPRHTTDSSSQAAIRAVGLVWCWAQHPAHLSAWTPSAQTQGHRARKAALTRAGTTPATGKPSEKLPLTARRG